MQFEWDTRKAEKNLEKHAISFQEAMSVFFDPLSATFHDPDHSIDEERYLTVGYSIAGRMLVVAHTDRDRRIRIISARLATAGERRRHET